MIKEILQMEEELVRQIDELKGDDRPSARLRRRNQRLQPLHHVQHR